MSHIHRCSMTSQYGEDTCQQRFFNIDLHWQSWIFSLSLFHNKPRMAHYGAKQFALHHSPHFLSKFDVTFTPSSFTAPIPWPPCSPHILLYPFRSVHSYLPRQAVSHSSVGLLYLLRHTCPCVLRTHILPVVFIQYFTIHSVKIIFGLSLFQVVIHVLSKKTCTSREQS